MYAVTFTELDTAMITNSFAAASSVIDAGDAPSVLDWTKARCRDGNGTLTHLFFSDEPIAIARAKAICGKCPLSATCLEGALERVEPWGVWGGELIESGRIVVNKRPRGRPPKHPRPLVVINEDAIAVPVRVA
ncbi:MAG: putative WhiB family transcriptional regulator [Ilumatobacteraceae bacterium]|nr:putative WhiB family transcriptional regulator [Ilumatobacteraceae bacterium]